MTSPYQEVETSLRNCEKAITIALKVEHRDKAKINKLRTEHHTLTAKLAQSSRIEKEEEHPDELKDDKKWFKKSKKND